MVLDKHQVVLDKQAIKVALQHFQLLHLLVVEDKMIVLLIERVNLVDQVEVVEVIEVIAVVQEILLL